jgi:IclR family acetate operon transcriptional repressor
MKSASRVIDAIHFLRDHPGASLGEIADVLRVHKSSASRLMRTIEQQGWAARDEAGLTYHMGPTLISIGRAAVDQFLRSDRLLPILESLRDISGESVHLALFDHYEMLHVMRVDSPDVIRVSCPVGTWDPLHCTALGKAFLASLPDEERRRLVLGLKPERRTPNTITDRKVLLAELEATHARGYAIDREEGRVGVRCIALALVDAQGRSVGAISITGPAFRWTQRAMDRVIDDILAAADRGMRAAGYAGLTPRRAARSRV